MLSLEVRLAERSYPVRIGSGLLGDPAAWQDRLPTGPVVIVSNPVVAPLYLGKLRSALGERPVHELLLPDGEPAKSVDNWSRIHDFLASIGAGRDSCLLALGGGVIGDLTGFAAATWMRGIAFIQAPTTLLAQVDASVGGKTGINHAQGKNLVGAFHQPALVVADIDTFATLPAREYRAGLAEVLKYGAICDAGMLAWCEAQALALKQRESEAVSHAVGESVRHKARVVAADERESGQRALLNFGHTFAHALESHTGYARYLHGEAVAAGMVVAACLSEMRGLCEAGIAGRLREVLAAWDLPTRIPADIPTAALLARMQLDKKNLAGRRRLILLHAAGQAVVDSDSSEREIAAAIDACR